MHINLAYGSGQIPVDVPDNWINGRCYRPHSMAPVTDVRAEIMSAIGDLTGDASLARLAEGKDRVLVVVDSTTPALFDEALPALLEIIEDETHLAARDITLLLTNPPWGRSAPIAEVAGSLPAGLRKSHQVLLHDPDDDASLAQPDKNVGKQPISLNKAYLEAPLRIALGAVRPDLLLGFSGGRSLLVPGLAGRETLQSLLSFNNIGNRNARPGNFRDNPFHLAGVEAVHSAGCELLVSAVLNPDGAIHAIKAGHILQSHLLAMRTCREAMLVKVKEPMDIVVTCGGGAPRDGTLWDLVQTVSMVLPVLKREGTIVLAGALENGIGPPAFEQILSHNGGVQKHLRALALCENRGPAHWVAQKLFSILQEHEIILYNTSIEEDVLWRAGLTPSRDINEAILGAMESHGQRCKIVALPDGPLGLGDVATRSESSSAAL